MHRFIGKWWFANRDFAACGEGPVPIGSTGNCARIATSTITAGDHSETNRREYLRTIGYFKMECHGLTVFAEAVRTLDRHGLVEDSKTVAPDSYFENSGRPGEYRNVRTQAVLSTNRADNAMERWLFRRKSASVLGDCGSKAGCGQGIANGLSPSARGLPPSVTGLPPSAKTCHHLPRPVSRERRFCDCESDLAAPVADMDRDDIRAWIRVRAGGVRRVRCVEHHRPAGKSGPSPRGACHRLPHP